MYGAREISAYEVGRQWCPTEPQLRCSCARATSYKYAYEIAGRAQKRLYSTNSYDGASYGLNLIRTRQTGDLTEGILNRWSTSEFISVEEIL